MIFWQKFHPEEARVLIECELWISFNSDTEKKHIRSIPPLLGFDEIRYEWTDEVRLGRGGLLDQMGLVDTFVVHVFCS